MGAVDFKALGDEFVLDNLSVQKRYHHFETVFNKLSSNEQKMIEEKASAELNPYTRDLLQRKSDSVTANQAFKISRKSDSGKALPHWRIS